MKNTDASNIPAEGKTSPLPPSVKDCKEGEEKKGLADASTLTTRELRHEDTDLSQFEILDSVEIRLRIDSQWVYRGNQSRRWFYLADRGNAYPPSGIAEPISPEAWFALEEVARLRASLASLGARLKKEPIAFQAETQMSREQQTEETGNAL